MSRRPLGVLCAGLVLAAALLWAAGSTVWFVVAPAGRPAVPVSGGQVSALPGATALLALAGVAGVVAAPGVARRVVGLLLAGVALAVGAVGVGALRGGAPDVARTLAGLPGDPPVEPTGAAWLAVAGAAVLAAVGLFVLVSRPTPVRLGARAGRADRTPAAETDPDRAAWRALDAGRDPTADEPPAG